MVDRIDEVKGGHWHKSGCPYSHSGFSVICDCHIELSKLIDEETTRARIEEIEMARGKFYRDGTQLEALKHLRERQDKLKERENSNG